MRRVIARAAAACNLKSGTHIRRARNWPAPRRPTPHYSGYRLELASSREGPLFRPINRHEQLSDKWLTDFAVAVIIRRVAEKAGLATPQLSGHSLRAGFVTEAKKNGADDAAIMDQTGHESLATMHRYQRRTENWQKPASAKLGL